MESQRHAQFKAAVPLLCWELRGTKHGDDAEPAPHHHVLCGACKNTWTETDHAPPVLAMGEEQALKLTNIRQ